MSPLHRFLPDQLRVLNHSRQVITISADTAAVADNQSDVWIVAALFVLSAIIAAIAIYARLRTPELVARLTQFADRVRGKSNSIQVDSKSLGSRGEDLAAQYLTQRGYRILDRQARGYFGEIDIVAQLGDVIVFVEVKTRASRATGDPSEAVTATKQKKITRSAQAYLKKRRWLNRRCRFDVIGIIWPANTAAPELNHYVHAFEANDSY